jgi:two-component system, NarL family, response regulator NreC
MNKIRIILADDHQIIRDGLKMIFSNDKELEVIKEASNGLELMEILDQNTCDVLLLDISMPKLGGLESLVRIKETNPNLKVLMLTMHEEPEYVIKAFKNGADGYLLKNADHVEIVSAIKTLYEGKKYFNSTVANIIVDSLNKAPEATKPDVHLTLREQEVLKLVANGLSNKLIADDLSISQRTVETHRNNLIKKFDVFNTAELIKKAGEYKFI